MNHATPTPTYPVEEVLGYLNAGVWTISEARAAVRGRAMILDAGDRWVVEFRRPVRKSNSRPDRLAWLAIAAVLLAALACGWSAWGQTTRPTAPKVIVAAWAQPPSMFATLKARGVNTVIAFDTEGKYTPKQCEDLAEASDLFYLTAPDTTRIADQARQPHRIGFIQADEPDLNRWKAAEAADSPNNGRLIPSGRYKGWTRPETLTSLYRACKAAAPDMPVLVNFAGATVTTAAYDHGEGHAPYIAAADWVSFDWHYLNQDASRYGIQQVRDAMRRLALWSAKPGTIVANGGTDVTGIALTPGSKLKLCYVEASDQNLSNANGRGPTVSEYEQQVRNVMSAGCAGWINFQTRFGEGWDSPKGFDGARLIPGLPDKMLALSLEFNGTAPTPPDPVELLRARVSALEADLYKAAASAAAADAKADAANARLSAVLDAITAARGATTRPATQPSN